MNLIGLTRSSDTRIENFQVFGERRSGTNAVEDFIVANTNLSARRNFGWKHGVPSFPIYPLSTLFIVVVRDPIDWFSALYRNPFEVKGSIADLDYSSFLRAEWQCVYRPRMSRWDLVGYDVDKQNGKGEELQLERHPLTGKRYRNVVELRSVKLLGHLSFLERGINTIAIRFEDFLADKVGFIETLWEAFEIEIHNPIKEQKSYVGPKFKRRKVVIPDPLPSNDLDFIMSQIDLDLENRCGYLLDRTD